MLRLSQFISAQGLFHVVFIIIATELSVLVWRHSSTSNFGEDKLHSSALEESYPRTAHPLTISSQPLRYSVPDAWV